MSGNMSNFMTILLAWKHSGLFIVSSFNFTATHVSPPGGPWLTVGPNNCSTVEKH